MAECIFCGHKFKGDKCDLCGTEYTWHQLLYAKERKEQQALADAGDVKASLRMGQYLHNQQDYNGCMSYLLTAANAGEGDAQSLLGQIYYHGLGTTPNKGESIMWHKMAAENGSGDSMFDMGLFYATGEGVDKDEKTAIYYFKKGAAIGHAKSLSSLGKMYYQGLGVEENKEMAIIYFKMAAEAGDEDSGGFLGWLQSKGELPEISESGEQKVKEELGMVDVQETHDTVPMMKTTTPPSHEPTFEETKQKAHEGEPWAQYYLGTSYCHGIGMKENKREGVKWIKLAAEQGFPEAQTYLGCCCLNGDGTRKDKHAAISWFKKAADQGDPSGQYNLAMCYGRGDGVNANFEMAVQWLHVAASQGHQGAIQILNTIEQG